MLKSSYAFVLAAAVISGQLYAAAPAKKPETAGVKVYQAPSGAAFSLKFPGKSYEVKRSATPGGYAVVVSKATYADKDWKQVAQGLALKHSGTIVVYDADVTASRAELAKLMPKYTCFVARPEEAGRKFVTTVHRFTRTLDSDAYTDTIWGIVTGYDASYAARIVSTTDPLTIKKGAGGTGIPLDLFDEGIFYDEGKENHSVVKAPGGKAEDKSCPSDTTKALVDVMNNFKPEFFQTSGHASERDWAIGYSYPNGRFVCKDGVLMGLDLQGKTYPVNSPNPKIYAPVGNCLIGHIPDKNCMALAFMGSGGVDQMIGYVVPTWYGYGGWGVLDYFEGQAGRFTFAESFYLNNQALVCQIQTRFPGTLKVAFDDWGPMGENINGMAVALGTSLPATDTKDAVGLNWDRDTVAFYGDPAWEARMKPREQAWDQKVTVSGDVYTVEITAKSDAALGRAPGVFLPHRVKLLELQKGAELRPVVTDNFVLLPDLTKMEKGKTYKVVFKAKKLSGFPAVGDPVAAIEKKPEIAPAFKTAGANAAQLDLALRGCEPSERKGMEFLIANMPDPDLKTLTAEFLLENVAAAYQAFQASPWAKQVPEDVFLNDVLPYANSTEKRDSWRADFYTRFKPIADKAKTPGEAAVALNAEIFKTLDVQYHATKRPKPDQSPYESMAAKYASCTGLSAILVDACRAVGVPARIAGTPLWSDNSGNHTWVEVWDNGGWHYTGAAEPAPLDQGWFTEAASKADPNSPEHWIYAASFKKTALTFPMVWAPDVKWVYAENVTERYAKKK